ncbi:MAG: hypothetical protein K0R54_352 [Clostridiaceae bacterium]|jgi:hypothetical protein|nr:hypothetical protein [Clostridiaceae bacterium]
MLMPGVKDYTYFHFIKRNKEINLYCKSEGIDLQYFKYILFSFFN